MFGISDRQTFQLLTMFVGGTQACEPAMLQELVDKGLACRINDRAARLTARGETMARELLRAERGSGSLWDSPRVRALVA